jgi:hypothetical protein
MKIKDKILWTFGDSFLASEANYISHYKKISNCDKVEIYAKPGSSLQYLLETILKTKKLIKPNDHLLIGIPGPLRGYYKNNHYVNYQLFIASNNLMSDKDLERDHLAFASHLINDIITSIKCDNVKIFTTVENECYNNYEYLPSMYCIREHIVNHIQTKLDIKSSKNIFKRKRDREYIEKLINRPPNHIPFEFEEDLSIEIVEHINSTTDIFVPLKQFEFDTIKIHQQDIKVL